MSNDNSRITTEVLKERWPDHDKNISKWTVKESKMNNDKPDTPLTEAEIEYLKAHYPPWTPVVLYDGWKQKAWAWWDTQQYKKSIPEMSDEKLLNEISWIQFREDDPVPGYREVCAEELMAEAGKRMRRRKLSS